ncbi:MAG: lipase family protein [Candidatus Thiodiazotropha weberae]|nr:lipase family protein [Candidatus Thiodiazotropha lotti]MCG7989600.1 lipase family protein [Candidatus Thiodiazotropha lotti]MCG8011870.1 lipase family protein [Candidatus Thiodiazotropha lotti]MCG8021543.1 lipase family protein [Candidatus Thiodiazotropha lotti]MCW4208711.1 lipase family protein [Candidatus Thiodiazotropha lotti]
MASENDIRKLNVERIELLIECSIQAYNALSETQLAQCAMDKVAAPAGFELIDSWSGVDSLFGREKTVETYGVVFRTRSAPWQYVFAFRGTDSTLDMLDDCGVEPQAFVPFESNAAVPDPVRVESGFNDIYRSRNGSVVSMQAQLFALIDKYRHSSRPLSEIYITGHSLGGALCQLFTLDLAISRPDIRAENINFASPRVGNKAFVDFYGKQTRHPTLRVVNVHDAVPHLPPSKLGFRHHPSAYLVAFHATDILGKMDLKVAHSSDNYQAVIRCASSSGIGICNNKQLQVAENLTICSELPELEDH